MFLYIIFFLFGFSFIYLLGNLVLSQFNQQQNAFSNIFFKSSLGITIIIISTAAYFTNFNSIILGLIFPLLFLFKNNKTKFSLNIINRTTLKELILLNTIIAIPIISLQFFFHPGLFNWTLIPVDLNYYSEISYYLGHGIESKYGSLTNLGIKNIPTKSPYHYAELWLNCFFFNLFPKINIGYSLMYITYPTLICIFFTGFLGLVFELSRNKYLIYSFSILALFIGPFDSLDLRNIFNIGNFLSSNTVIFENNGFFFNTLIFSYHGQKHALFYILFILFLTLFKTNKKNASIILSSSPFINFGILPGLLSGGILYQIIAFVGEKTRKLNLPKLYFTPIIITCVFYWLFYHFNSGKDIESQIKLIIFNSENLNIYGIISKMFFRLSYGLIFVSLIYFWVLIFVLIKKKKILYKYKTVLILTTCFIVCTLFSRIIIEGFNSAQIITYLLPCLNIILSLIFIEYIFLINKKIKYFIITFFLFICINNFYWTYFHSTTRREILIDKVYSKEFTNKCLRILNHSKNQRIGYLLGEKEAKTIDPGLWYGYYPCEFIFTQNYYTFFSLNYPYYNKNYSMSNFATNHMKFIYKYPISKKEYLDDLPGLVNNLKINFIVTKKDVDLPLTILKKSKLIIIDIKSKDKFIVLK